MGLTSLLAMAIVLLMVNDLVPKSSDLSILGAGRIVMYIPNANIAGRFVLAEIALIFLATIIATGLMYVQSYGQHSNKRPPQWLMKATLMYGIGKRRRLGYKDAVKVDKYMEVRCTFAVHLFKRKLMQETSSEEQEPIAAESEEGKRQVI